MIRKRRFTPAMRRRLAELDDKTGLDPALWTIQKQKAEGRLRVIDAQPEAWRQLLNDFPHQEVAELAERLSSPAEVRRFLERKGRTP